MRLYCSNIITPEALALAKKPGARYSGQAWIGGPSQMDDVPAAWLGPVVCDDEAPSVGNLAYTGSLDCITEVDRLVTQLKAHPQVWGYYGLPPAWNTYGYADTMPRWMQGWALQEIFLRQRAVFPSMYPAGHGDINYWIENTLYLALSCHEVVIPFVHPRVRWCGELLTKPEQLALIGGIAKYEHPHNGNKVRGVLPWFNGDDDLVTYWGMDAAMATDPETLRVVTSIQAAGPRPDIVKEQTDFIEVIRQVIV